MVIQSHNGAVDHMVTPGNTQEKRDERLSKNIKDLKGNINFLKFEWKKKKKGRKEKREMAQ